MKEIPMNKT